VKIFPSLISADILNLESVIKTFNNHCDGYHVDVMDDHFVPNLTWGPAFARAVVDATSLPIHLHLMVDNPERWLDRDFLLKDDLFVFHYEVFSDNEEIENFLQKLREKRYKIGIAINPDTAVEKIFPFASRIDHVLLMSVNPGFSGQKFMPEVVEKVAPLVELRKDKNLVFTIGMDGGVGQGNIKLLSQAGVDEVGIASAIFAQSDPVVAVKALYEGCEL
jgi:ribulose-phosphate 3-epimerase